MIRDVKKQNNSFDQQATVWGITFRALPSNAIQCKPIKKCRAKDIVASLSHDSSSSRISEPKLVLRFPQ